MTVIAKLARIPERDMRLAALAEHLRNAEPKPALWLLEAIVRGSIAREPDAIAVYDTLIDPPRLTALVGESRLDAMLQLAAHEGCVGAREWLRSSSLHEPETAVVTERLVAKG